MLLIKFNLVTNAKVYYNEGFLVDVLHVQRDYVFAAAQVKAALVLVHVEDPVVAGVEGEAEWPDGPRLQQFCGETFSFERFNPSGLIT